VEPIVPSLKGFRSDPIGFAGVEYLPLPRSKGGAFPFLLASLPASHGGRSGLTSIRLRRTALSQSSLRNNGFHLWNAKFGIKINVFNKANQDFWEVLIKEMLSKGQKCANSP